LGGGHTTAQFWEYDARLGRRWNIDPIDQISISNYACFGNNPIINIDPDGRYTLAVHYRMVYRAALRVGYSKEVADYMGYLASTYSDHPKPDVFNIKGLINTIKEIKLGRFPEQHLEDDHWMDESQTDDREHNIWHAMMSTKEKKEGMFRAYAKERGMTEGWKYILEAGNSANGDLKKFCRGAHILEDADAHEGASNDEHLGKKYNKKGEEVFTGQAWGMIIGDALGPKRDARRWTKAAMQIYALLQYDEAAIRDMTNRKGVIKINLKGVSDANISKIKERLDARGHTNVKIKK
jgi:hypothetical protein